jgi:hypothetical protein
LRDQEPLLSTFYVSRFDIVWEMDWKGKTTRLLSNPKLLSRFTTVVKSLIHSFI